MDFLLNIGELANNQLSDFVAHFSATAPTPAAAPVETGDVTVAGPETVTTGDISPEVTGGDVAVGNDSQYGPTFGDQDFGSSFDGNNLGSSFDEQNYGSSFDGQNYGSSFDGNNLGSSDIADLNSSPQVDQLDLEGSSLGSLASLLGGLG